MDSDARLCFLGGMLLLMSCVCCPADFQTKSRTVMDMAAQDMDNRKVSRNP